MELIYRLADVFTERFADLKAKWALRRDQVGQSQLLYTIVVAVIVIVVLIVLINALGKNGAFS